MVTPLDLLNKARKKNGGQDSLTYTALATNAQGSGSNIEHVDEIFSKAYKKSQDWNFNDIFVEVNTVASVETIATTSLTTLWEPGAIKEVRRQDGNNKPLLSLITPTKANELEDRFQNSKPIYWYVENESLKVLPVPDAVYTLQVRYQGLIPTISIDNIASTIVIPKVLQDALVIGIFSRLLYEDGDPEWVNWDGQFQADLAAALKRNNANYKKQGLKRFKMRRSADFKL